MFNASKLFFIVTIILLAATNSNSTNLNINYKSITTDNSDKSLIYFQGVSQLYAENIATFIENEYEGIKVKSIRLVNRDGSSYIPNDAESPEIHISIDSTNPITDDILYKIHKIILELSPNVHYAAIITQKIC